MAGKLINEEFQVPNNPCPICGGKHFIIGMLSGYGREGAFVPYDGAVIRRRKPIVARTCSNCGNVLLFAKYKPYNKP